MKCEICHKNEAQTAIPSVVDGVDDELYVCMECAKSEKIRRQKKSQRTRKESALPPGLSMSVTQIGGGEPPPQLLEALMNAVQNAVSGMRSPDGGEGGNGVVEFSAPVRIEGTPAPKKPVPSEYVSLRGLDKAILMSGGMQLEGLFLIGEVEAAKRSARALGMELVGYNIDGVSDSGHIYRLMHSGDRERARRFREELVVQEVNARIRLFEDMSRYFSDALCRSLAILKNARLLSSGELLDLLSPLRLAALEAIIDGISFGKLESLIASIDVEEIDMPMDPKERDKVDAARADEMNKLFEDVVLNERAEGRFL